MEFMNSVPLEVWAGLLGVAIGSALSLFGTWLNSKSNLNQLRIRLRHQQQANETELLKSRLEELYTLVGAWANFMAGKYLSVAMVMQGKLTYNQHYDLYIKDKNVPSYDFNRIEMIIDIYGDDLQEAYEKVIEARSKLTRIESEFKRAYEGGDIDGERFLKEYLQAQHEIEERGRLLKDAIAFKTKNA